MYGKQEVPTPPPTVSQKKILFFFPLAVVEKRPCDAQDIPNPPTHPSSTSLYSMNMYLTVLILFLEAAYKL